MKYLLIAIMALCLIAGISCENACEKDCTPHTTEMLNCNKCMDRGLDASDCAAIWCDTYYY